MSDTKYATAPTGTYKLKNLFQDDFSGIVEGMLTLNGKEIGQVVNRGNGAGTFLQSNDQGFQKFLTNNEVSQEDMLNTLVEITVNNRKRRPMLAVGEQRPFPMNANYDFDKEDTDVFSIKAPMTITDEAIVNGLAARYPGKKLWRWSKADSNFLPLN